MNRPDGSDADSISGSLVNNSIRRPASAASQISVTDARQRIEGGIGHDAANRRNPGPAADAGQHVVLAFGRNAGSKGECDRRRRHRSAIPRIVIGADSNRS
jgi:hypothetical protein